jgi:hypothetical protein
MNINQQKRPAVPAGRQLAIIKRIDDFAINGRVHKNGMTARKAKPKAQKNDPFKGWCMPEQPRRYIKPGKFDPL